MKMLVRLVVAVCLVGGVCAAQGGGKRPMTFADLMAMKRVSDPQISVSGKWVLFSVTEVSLEKNSKVNHLWVVPLGGSGGGEADSSAALRNDKQGAVRNDKQKERQVTKGSGESNGRFSPDGKWVMYSSAEGGSSQIWVAPWDDAVGAMGAGHVVTGLETEADGGVWAPDSKHFLFVSSVYPECESHAAMGTLRNEEEANCNALKDALAAKNPVKAMVFEHLLYRHWNSFVGAKHSHVFYGSVDQGAPTDLTPASVVGDHEAPTFSLGGPTGYAISPDGREVAYVVNMDKVPAASTNNDVFVLQVGAEPSTARKVSTSAGSDDGPAYSPDGKWLAWRSQKRNGFESDKFALVVMDRGTGKVRDVLPNFNSWVDEFIYSNSREGANSFFYVASPEKGEEPILVGPRTLTHATLPKLKVDAKSGLPLPPPAPTHLVLDGFDADGSKITFPAGEYSGMQLSSDGNHLVAVRMTVDHPSELWAHLAGPCDQSDIACIRGHRPDEYGGGQFTHVNDALLSNLSLASLEPFWFTGAEGTKVEGFIVKPPNFDPAKKYPVKFLMHGGPQTAWGDAWSYRWNWELMAAGGYVVVGVNRRGSTGYGQKFVDEVSGDWGGKAFVDLMKGLDAAEAKFPFIDKNRECALGASYGGFMANWVLTHTDRFKCIVTHDGMYNPQSAYGSTEEVWFNEWEFRPTVGVSKTQIPYGNDNKKSSSKGEKQVLRSAQDDSLGGGGGVGMVEQTKPAQPWDYFGLSNEADPFRKWSPMLHIKDARTPTLVIHSQRDYRLDVSEGFQLFTALQRLGVPSKMLYFPDEGHWVMKPRNSELWYETVGDWCDRWLGVGKYEAVGAEKNPMAGAVRRVH